MKQRFIVEIDYPEVIDPSLVAAHLAGAFGILPVKVEKGTQQSAQQIGVICWKCRRESVIDGYCRNASCSEFYPRH